MARDHGQQQANRTGGGGRLRRRRHGCCARRLGRRIGGGDAGQGKRQFAQPVERAVVDQPALVQAQHAFDQARRRRAMRDQQQGAAARLPGEQGEELRLAGGVQVRGGLVEQPQRRCRMPIVAQQCACQGEALQLPARQAVPVLAQRRVESLRQHGRDLGQAGGLRRRLHLGVGCRVARQADVLAQRAGKPLGALADPDHAPAQGGPVERAEVAAAQVDPARRRDELPEHQIEQRGLAGAAGAHQRHALAWPQREGHAVERHPPVGVHHAQVVHRKLQRALRQRAARLARRRCAGRCCQRRQRLRRAQRMRPRVVVLPELPQRRMKLGRQHQHKQGGGQRGRGPPAADADVEPAEQHQPEVQRDHGDGERGQQLQHRRGQKGDPQHAHGALAIALGGVGHDRALGRGHAEQLERRQALEQIEKASAHGLQLGELPAAGRIGAAADQDHEQRNQRRGGEQDRRGHP